MGRFYYFYQYLLEQFEMKIVADQNIPHLHDYFTHDEIELILKPGRAISPQDVKKADMLLVRSITPVNAALLQDSTVKFVGSITSGIDHVDTAWLYKAGITWTRAAGFN